MIVDRPRPGPLPGSYWIVPGLFAAGAWPAASGHGLVGSGITQVVDLTECPDNDHDGQVVRFPIADLDVPDRGRMVDILETIDGAIASGTGVYVHCMAGIGRTGTVVGCWLIRHGHAVGAEAMSVIAWLRSATDERPLRSPETEEQRAFVASWTELS